MIRLLLIGLFTLATIGPFVLMFWGAPPVFTFLFVLSIAFGSWERKA